MCVCYTVYVHVKVYVYLCEYIHVNRVLSVMCFTLHIYCRNDLKIVDESDLCATKSQP